jgi:hypothetical protein
MENEDRITNLGRNPPEALRRWSKLDGKEKWIVIDSMARHYDLTFAKHFMEQCNKRQRPDQTIEVVNDRSLTPEKLKSAGYGKKGDVGGAQIWVHPTGKELWLLSPPKALPAPPQSDLQARPQLQPVEHEDVQAAREKVEEIERKKRTLEDRFRQLMARKGSRGWAEEAAEFTIDLTDFGNEVATIEVHDFPDWAEGLDGDDLAKIQKLKQRLSDCYLDLDTKPLDDADPDGSLLRAALKRRGRERLWD